MSPLPLVKFGLLPRAWGQFSVFHLTVPCLPAPCLSEAPLLSEAKGSLAAISPGCGRSCVPWSSGYVHSRALGIYSRPGLTSPSPPSLWILTLNSGRAGLWRFSSLSPQRLTQAWHRGEAQRR